MTKQKGIEDPECLSIYVEQKLKNHLRIIASKATLREGRYISISELVRETLAAVFNFEKEEQLDLFRKKTKKRLNKVLKNKFKEEQLKMFE